MVKIKILSGPFAGRTREIPEEADPMVMFTSLVRHGWTWEVDYSGSTEGEIFLWFRAELAVRIIRALQRGLPVRFLDREWRVEPGGNILQVTQDLEDAIVASGRLMTIDSDDERGLVVGVRGYEM